MVPEAGIEPARLSARDFLTTSTFATAQHLAGRSWSGARLHHSLAAAGARRLLSTPSQAVAWTWLGVGSDAEASRAFADFDGLHFERFPPKAQIVQVPCVYRFHHSGVVLNTLKTPTSIYWRLAGPWPSSLAAKLQLGCPQTVVTIDLVTRWRKQRRLDKTDFKSAVSTSFTTGARQTLSQAHRQGGPCGAIKGVENWRRDPESNRTRRICNPLHNRFAIAPGGLTR